MAIALMGPIELLMILTLGGGVPVVMPPLEADAGMMSVAPQECMFYASWYGVADPVAGSGNSTEALMAEPQVQEFLRTVTGAIESLVTDPNVPRDMREGADVFLPLFKNLYQRPVTLYFGGIEMPNGLVGPPDVDGAIVVHCGARKESLVGSMQKLEALFAASTNLQVNEIDRSGTKFRKFMLPPDAPEMGWGISGDYLVFAVGANTFDDVLRRISAKRGPPQWLQDVHTKLSVDRPEFAQYFNVAKAIETLNLVMPIGGEDVGRVTQALGLNSIRHIATVQGYDTQSVVSKTHVATIGPPHGVLELLVGEPLSIGDLRGIPADANLAYVLKMDMEAKLNKMTSLARSVDPGAGDMFEQAIAEFGQEFGLDLREDLFGPLGDVIRVYNSPESGGLLFTGLTVVADVDDANRLQATHERLLTMLRQSFDRYGDDVAVNEYNFGGTTIYHLSLGSEAPLAPAWCLTENKLVFGLYPQSVKAFLSGDSSGSSLAENKNVQALFADGNAPYLISYQDTRDIIRTVYPFVQIFAPIMADELRREGFNFDIASIPSANAVLPHLTPSVSACKSTSDGLLFESHQSVPGLSSLPALAVLGLGITAVEERSFNLGPAYPEAQNNLRQLAIAMHNYHDVHGRLPAAVNADANGKPLLSWRVHLLPYLEQQALYEQFHFDEPWDSEHNLQLLEKMPDVFASPGGEELERGMTSFLVPTGDATIFPIGAGGPGKGLSLASIRDGTSNTVMIVEATPDQAVPWTKPADWEYDDKAQPSVLVGHRQGGFLAAFADAHVALITEFATAEDFHAIFTRDGGEIVDVSWLEDGSGAAFEDVGPILRDQVPPPVIRGGIRD